MESMVQEFLTHLDRRMDEYGEQQYKISEELSGLRKELNSYQNIVNEKVVKVEKDLEYIKKDLKSLKEDEKESINVLWKNFRECKSSCDEKIKETSLLFEEKIKEKSLSCDEKIKDTKKTITEQLYSKIEASNLSVKLWVALGALSGFTSLIVMIWSKYI